MKLQHATTTQHNEEIIMCVCLLSSVMQGEVRPLSTILAARPDGTETVSIGWMSLGLWESPSVSEAASPTTP